MHAYTLNNNNLTMVHFSPIHHHKSFFMFKIYYNYYKKTVFTYKKITPNVFSTVQVIMIVLFFGNLMPSSGTIFHKLVVFFLLKGIIIVPYVCYNLVMRVLMYLCERVIFKYTE